MSENYLHGYSKEEQDRLLYQARFFEQTIFRNVDFSAQTDILEIGCGVGAQSEILLRRFPHIRLTAVDASESQLERARSHLKKGLESGRVTFQQARAEKLPFESNRFDGVFIAWLLEHVKTPLDVLKEAHRVMRPDAILLANEVLNATFFLEPYSPATQKYWFEFNDHQWTSGGDPFVGAKLGNLLIQAGFRDIQTRPITVHYDHRTPKRRAEFIEFWRDLLLSGSPGLIQAGRVTPDLVNEMKAELSRVAHDPQAVIFFSWIQATARAL